MVRGQSPQQHRVRAKDRIRNRLQAHQTCNHRYNTTFSSTDLLRAENSAAAVEKAYLGCFSCLRLHHSTRFPHRPGWGRNGAKRHERQCINCPAARPGQSTQSRIQNGKKQHCLSGIWWGTCDSCGRYQPVGHGCRPVAVKEEEKHVIVKKEQEREEEQLVSAYDGRKIKKEEGD